MREQGSVARAALNRRTTSEEATARESLGRVGKRRVGRDRTKVLPAGRGREESGRNAETPGQENRQLVCTQPPDDSLSRGDTSENIRLPPGPKVKPNQLVAGVASIRYTRVREAFRKTKRPPACARGPSNNSRRRPTLPHGLPCSTIGAGGLNFSVRNGKRCDPSAIATGKLSRRAASAPFLLPESGCG